MQNFSKKVICALKLRIPVQKLLKFQNNITQSFNHELPLLLTLINVSMLSQASGHTIKLQHFLHQSKSVNGSTITMFHLFPINTSFCKHQSSNMVLKLVFSVLSSSSHGIPSFC